MADHPLPAPKLKPFHKRLFNAFVALGVGKQVTLVQLRQQMGYKAHEQQQLRKRIEELRKAGYPAHRTDLVKDGEWLYVLDSTTPILPEKSTHGISNKVRAEVLHRSGRRCAMCGRSPTDGVKLAIDHRYPRDWGGSDDVDNLEVLCTDCNGGKKAYFASLDPKAMRRCIGYEDATQRIGELLKLFKGKVPPRRLIAAVAMEDEWPRRLRELRDLGWDVKSVRVKGQRGAARFSYQLLSEQPWPADIRAAIAAAAKKRGAKSLH